MKLVFTLILLSLTCLVHAEKIRSRVHSIVYSEKSGVPHIVKLENGRVAFLNSESKMFSEALELGQLQGHLIEFDLDKKFYVRSLQNLGRSEEPEVVPSETPKDSYVPSVLNSDAEAATIFGRMKKVRGNSQCYNRAHVWTYEENQRSGLKWMKVFLFFTDSYIRNYNYKWWFHVSPYLYVATDSGPSARIMDHTFMRGPVDVKTWTDNFIYSHKTCPIVNKYSDYTNHQQEQDCYLIPVSQYFWQPYDIENYEKTGYLKTQFYANEVRSAYWDATSWW